jgi:hypothetical protein
MGSLAGMDTELDIHPPLKTLCRTVRLNTRTVQPHLASSADNLLQSIAQ